MLSERQTKHEAKRCWVGFSRQGVGCGVEQKGLCAPLVGRSSFSRRRNTSCNEHLAGAREREFAGLQQIELASTTAGADATHRIIFKRQLAEILQFEKPLSVVFQLQVR